MDINAITQLIGSYGFPIICCAYMMTTFNKTIQSNTTALKELSTIITQFINREGAKHE